MSFNYARTMKVFFSVCVRSGLELFSLSPQTSLVSRVSLRKFPNILFTVSRCLMFVEMLL